MSFGFSVGDFIRVFELARDTYHDCRHAPSQFQDAGRGADSLRIVLEGIHAEIRNPSSILHRNERTATDFAMCAKRCETELLRLKDIVTKYRSLGTDKPKAIDRFKFPKKELMDIRGKLVYHTSTLTAFVNTIGLGIQGRLDDNVQKSLGLQKDTANMQEDTLVLQQKSTNMQRRTINLQKESMNLQHATIDIQQETLEKQDKSLAMQRHILDAIDRYAAEARVGGNLSSILSDHSNDEKGVWKDLRSRLISEGIKSRSITENESAIVERIQELIHFNMFDSEVETDCTSSIAENSELSWDETEVPQSAAADGDNGWDFMNNSMHSAKIQSLPELEMAEDIHQDGESEATVTPKGSIENLQRPSIDTTYRSPCVESVAANDADSEGTITPRLSRKSSRRDLHKSPTTIFDRGESKIDPPALHVASEGRDITPQGVFERQASSYAFRGSDIVSDLDIPDDRSVTSTIADRRSTIYSIQRPGLRADRVPSSLTRRSSPDDHSTKMRIWRGLNGFNMKGRYCGRNGDYVVLEDVDGQDVLVSYSNLTHKDKDRIAVIDDRTKKSTQDGRVHPDDGTVRQEPNRIDADRSSPPISEPVSGRTIKKPWRVGKRSHNRVTWTFRSPSWASPTGYYIGSKAADALPSAAAKGDLELVKALLRKDKRIHPRGTSSLNNDRNVKATALPRAVKNGHFQVVKYLLESGANVEVHSYTGTLLVRAIYNRDPSMARLLLEYGVNVNGRDDIFNRLDAFPVFTGPESLVNSRCPPLYLAAETGQRDLVRLLLDYEVNINILGPYHETPLSIAARRGHFDAVELLLQEGAYTGVIMRDGQSALPAAVDERHCDIVRLLLEYGADPNSRHSGLGDTVLFIASQQEDAAMVKELLKYGADPNLPNKRIKGKDAFAMRDFDRIRRRPKTRTVSPLGVAAESGHIEVVEQLLEYGADVNQTHSDTRHPVNLAAGREHFEIVALLRNHGAVLSDAMLRKVTGHEQRQRDSKSAHRLSSNDSRRRDRPKSNRDRKDGRDYERRLSWSWKNDGSGDAINDAKSKAAMAFFIAAAVEVFRNRNKPLSASRAFDAGFGAADGVQGGPSQTASRREGVRKEDTVRG